jgi:hypothetical protein
MQEYSQYIKSDFIHHEPRELLPMPISILLGVSPEAEESLKSLRIFSVFDLAVSHIFANAKKITEAARSTNTTFGRYGGVPSDVVDNDGHYIDVTELHLQPVQLLEGIGPNNGSMLVNALQVQKIRDLALWPPYVAAFNIVTSILTPENTPEFDPEAPPDLIPKSGEFPTEKVFYDTVVIDEIEGQDVKDLDGQVDIANIGIIITMEQAWYAQGVALGNLLHSVALGPGESTKISMVDWSRQTSGSTGSETSQEESLSSGSSHNRAISEVTNAVATEAQGGFSNSSSASISASVGMGVGGAFGTSLLGVTESVSGNVSTAMTVSASYGRRDLMASMNQNVADRTQQHANSSRTRRATVVQEVSQIEKETLTTRTVTNYNHMHALSIQYYEIVQIYRTTTRVNNVEKCLFIPMKPIDFSNLNSIDRFRDILSIYALNDKARSALDTRIQLVEIQPLMPWSGWKSSQSLMNLQNLIEIARESTGNFVSPDIAASMEKVPNWRLHNQVFLEELRIEVPGDDYHEVRIARKDNPDVIWEGQIVQNEIHFKPASPIPISDIRSIYAINNSTSINDVQEGGGDLSISLVFSYEGNTFKHELSLFVTTYDFEETENGLIHRFFKFNYSGYILSDWLLKHLDQNRLYYSQAIWMNMGSAALSMTLSQYTYNQKSLLQQIDPIPVATTGNYIGFRMNADPGKDEEWATWLKEHGYYEDNAEDNDNLIPKNTAVHETVPLPSGGVFAEAVLGRYNSAEKLDMTRFWNWQDSPIPIAAPEIAALQAGGKTESIAPGTDPLESPLVQIMTPTSLPDPQGLSSIINALTTSNMFRDMSGMAQSAALAQAAMQAASNAATAAGNQAGANMATAGQLQVEMAKAIMPLLTMAAGAAMGVPVPPMGGSQGKSNISNAGAIQNEAAKIDAKNRKSGGSSGSTSGGNATGGSTSGGSEATSLEGKSMNTMIDGVSSAVPGGNGTSTGGNVEFASTGKLSGEAVLEVSPPDSLKRLPELLAQAKPGQWIQNGDFQRDVTRGEVYGPFMVVFPASGQLFFLDESDHSLYRTDYNTFFRRLIPLQALADGGAQALWLDQIARVEFELMIGAIFGIPEIIAIRSLTFIETLNRHQDEAAILMEYFPALLHELKWFNDNLPTAAKCIMVSTVQEVFKNIPSSLTTLSAEKWAYLLGRFLKGSIASEGATNLLLNLTKTFTLTLAAFTALTVVPNAGTDLIDEKVDDLKDGLNGEGINVEDHCLRAAITDLLNHQNPDELKLKLGKIAMSAEQLVPALKKLFLESGSTLI